MVRNISKYLLFFNTNLNVVECFVKLNSKLKVKTNINLIVKSEKEAHHRKKSESHHHHGQ